MRHHTMLTFLVVAVFCGCDQSNQTGPSPAPPETPTATESRERTERVGRLIDPDRPDVVILRGREETLEVELIQGGRTVPRRDGGEYRLEAKPFTIRLRGDTARTSYIATTDFSKTQPLDELDRPLVFSSGSGGLWPGDSLALMYEDEVSIGTADSDFFRRQWIAREGRAEELAGFLRNTLGRTPAIASFRHYHLGLTGRTSQEGTVEADRFPPGEDEGEADFTIKEIGQKPVGEVPRVRLVVFFQSPIGRTFSQVAWETFDLHFAGASED